MYMCVSTFAAPCAAAPLGHRVALNLVMHRRLAYEMVTTLVFVATSIVRMNHTCGSVKVF